MAKDRFSKFKVQLSPAYDPLTHRRGSKKGAHTRTPAMRSDDITAQAELMRLERGISGVGE